jgi:hypothetical protein
MLRTYPVEYGRYSRSFCDAAAYVRVPPVADIKGHARTIVSPAQGRDDEGSIILADAHARARAADG